MALGNLGGYVVNVSANLKSYLTGLSQSEVHAYRSGSRAAKNFSMGFQRLQGFIAPALGVFSVQALAGMTKEAAIAGESIVRMARGLGLGTDRYQEFGFAAKLVGMDVADLDRNLKIFNRTLGDAQRGSKAAQQSFGEMGIDLLDNEGRFKTMDAVLFEVADKFAAMGNETRKASLAQDLFGKGSFGMIQFLNEGAAGLGEMGRQAHDLNLVLTGEALKGVEDFEDQLGILSDQITTETNRALLEHKEALMTTARAWKDLKIAGIEYIAWFVDAIPNSKNELLQMGAGLKLYFLDAMEAVATATGQDMSDPKRGHAAFEEERRKVIAEMERFTDSESKATEGLNKEAEAHRNAAAAAREHTSAINEIFSKSPTGEVSGSVDNRSLIDPLTGTKVADDAAWAAFDRTVMASRGIDPLAIIGSSKAFKPTWSNALGAFDRGVAKEQAAAQSQMNFDPRSAQHPETIRYPRTAAISFHGPVTFNNVDDAVLKSAQAAK